MVAGMIPPANAAARLARWLMRRAWRPWGLRHLAFAALLVALWIGCAAWAAWIANAALPGGPPRWLTLLGDLAYAPLTYLAPQTNHALGLENSLPAQVARFAGPAVPALGLFWILRRRALAGLAGLVARQAAAGHVVIEGAEGSADALATATSEAGHCTVLLDATLAPDDPRTAGLGRAGVVTLPRVEERAGLLNRAALVAVWRPGDAASLAAALGLRARLDDRADRDIIVRIGSAAAQRNLRQATSLLQASHDRLRPLSPEGAAVRAALGDEGLVAEAVARQADCVQVCLWGAGPALPWVAETVLRQCWSIRLGPPRVLTAAAKDPESELASIAARLAAGANVFEADQAPGLFPLPVDPAQAGITRHVVAEADDDATLARAFALASTLRQAEENPPGVQAVLRQSDAAAVLLAAANLPFLPPIVLEEWTSLPDLAARPRDEVAARMHLAYLRSAGGQDLPAGNDWRAIAETYVQANRALADHLAVKRADAAAATMSPADLVDALARVEHRRWCAERILEGWIAGPDNSRRHRRIHPDLAPWAALGEATRDKDRAMVREALGLDGG
jgi:RyR domain